MHRHIFILGIILTIITIPAYASYWSRDTTDVWTDSGHTTPAKEICESDTDDCSSALCWLPNGTYCDDAGTFTETCTVNSSCPGGQYDTEIPTYACVDSSGSVNSDFVYTPSGQCECTNGKNDIGLAMCINPSTGGMNSSSDTSAKTWSVTFDYATISGIASCNSSSSSNSGDVNTTADFSTTSSGGYCWCQMTSPATSYWVYEAWYLFSSSCASACAEGCASYIQSNHNVRSTMFSNIKSGKTELTPTVTSTTQQCIDPSATKTKKGYWDFGGNTSNTSEYGLTATGQWGITFSYGNVTGIASCNSTRGTIGASTNTEFSNTSDGRYCWCKMTGPVTSKWVFTKDRSSSSSCNTNCAYDCSNMNTTVYSGILGSSESAVLSDNFDQSSAQGMRACAPTSCPDGYYLSGKQCKYCDKVDFGKIETENNCSSCYTHSRLKSCTDVNVGDSSCSCSEYSYTDMPWLPSDGQYVGGLCVLPEDPFVVGYDFNEGGTKTWTVHFSCGDVSGIAACSTQAGTDGVATTEDIVHDPNGNECWCKMTSPATSRWVYRYDGYNQYRPTYCVEKCAEACANQVRDYTSAVQKGLFSSI